MDAVRDIYVDTAQDIYVDTAQDNYVDIAQNMYCEMGRIHFAKAQRSEKKLYQAQAYQKQA